MNKKRFQKQEESMIQLYLENESVNEGILHEKLTHWHDNDIELIYVIKGSMICQTNHDVFQLQKGDLCFINNNQLHRLSCDGKNPCEHKALILNMKIFANNPEIFEQYIRPILEDQSFAHVRFQGTSGASSKIYTSMERIEKLKDEKPLGYELGIISESFAIMQQLYSVYISGGVEKTKVDYNRSILQQMLEYIYDHYGSQMTLEDIALAGNSSTSKCNRIFKEYTNQSPITYLNNYRLEKSAEMLKTSDMTIALISQMCGFSQQSYFNRMFIREYGVTPLKYRNVHYKQA